MKRLALILGTLFSQITSSGASPCVLQKPMQQGIKASQQPHEWILEVNWTSLLHPPCPLPI